MILIYFCQTAVPILHRIAGESGVQEKEIAQLTPLQDQMDMSNKELQLKFIINREDNRQNDSCTLQLLQKVYKFEENPPQEKTKSSRTQRQC
jgi:protein subunit release factor B